MSDWVVPDIWEGSERKKAAEANKALAELLAAAKNLLECGDRGCPECLGGLEIAVAKAEAGE